MAELFCCSAGSSPNVDGQRAEAQATKPKFNGEAQLYTRPENQRMELYFCACYKSCRAKRAFSNSTRVENSGPMVVETYGSEDKCVTLLANSKQPNRKTTVSLLKRRPLLSLMPALVPSTGDFQGCTPPSGYSAKLTPGIPPGLYSRNQGKGSSGFGTPVFQMLKSGGPVRTPRDLLPQNVLS